MRVVSDGCSRLRRARDATTDRRALRARIEREVRAELAPKYHGAGFMGRVWLDIHQELEIRRRCRAALAPPDALYWKQSPHADDER